MSPDMLRNLEVFVSRIGYWGWLIEGGKMHILRIDFITEFLWAKLKLKSENLEVNSRILCTVLGVGGGWLRELKWI